MNLFPIAYDGLRVALPLRFAWVSAWRRYAPPLREVAVTPRHVPCPRLGRHQASHVAGQAPRPLCPDHAPPCSPTITPPQINPMSDTSSPLVPPRPDPNENKRKWITMQITVSRDLYQEVKGRLNELSERTGIDFPISRFAFRTFAGHWKTEFERAQKSFEKYSRTTT